MVKKELTVESINEMKSPKVKELLVRGTVVAEGFSGPDQKLDPIFDHAGCITLDGERTKFSLCVHCEAVYVYYGRGAITRHLTKCAPHQKHLAGKKASTSRAVCVVAPDPKSKKTPARQSQPVPKKRSLSPQPEEKLPKKKKEAEPEVEEESSQFDFNLLKQLQEMTNLHAESLKEMRLMRQEMQSARLQLESMTAKLEKKSEESMSRKDVEDILKPRLASIRKALKNII